jgi:hypothetical protein
MRSSRGRGLELLSERLSVREDENGEDGEENKGL